MYMKQVRCRRNDRTFFYSLSHFCYYIIDQDIRKSVFNSTEYISNVYCAPRERKLLPCHETRSARNQKDLVHMLYMLDMFVFLLFSVIFYRLVKMFSFILCLGHIQKSGNNKKRRFIWKNRDLSKASKFVLDLRLSQFRN